MSTMAAKRDYYEVLGVRRDATEAQIKAAYKELAIKYHPDKNPGDEEAAQRFKEVAEAYEVLRDPEKRSRYDRFGHAGLERGGRGGFPVDDPFAIFEGAFGDLFEGLFGGRGRGRRAGRGGDIHCDVTLEFLEAARGARKRIRYERLELCRTCQGSGMRPGTRAETCRYCGGSGQVVQVSGFFRVQTTCPACRGEGQQIRDPCPECQGARQVRRRVEREVDFPPGVDTGHVLPLRGEGHESTSGGAPGDLLCHIKVKPHKLFKRHGPDLICEVPVSMAQAALGGEIEVPTIDGPMRITLPAGTQPGSQIELRGRGLADPNGRGRGDLLLLIQVEIPQQLTARQRELLQAFAQEEERNQSRAQKSFLEKLKSLFVSEEDSAA